MMQVMKDIGGVEIPETLAKFTAADGKRPDAATADAAKAV